MSQLIYSSIFGELTKMVQARIDAASKLNKELFDKVIFEDYLDWDTPSVGLSFEELIGSYGISIAAPTIGDNSKEAILPTEGVQTLSEKVLKHALTKPMTIQDYRKVLQIMDSKSITDQAKKKQLVDLMWGTVQTPVNSVLAKLDMIFLGGLSNEGQFTFNTTNNPEGGVRATIDYNQPASNIATSTTAWTAANKATVDCFGDIQAILDAAMDKVELSKILCSPALIAYMCSTTNVHKMIWGNDASSKIVRLADLNEYMKSNDLPVFVPIRRNVRVMSGQAINTVNPWITANMVFVPDGKLGVVKNAYADSELREEPGVTYSNYGRIRVSQWGVGETQNSNGVEFAKAECYALPVITEMNGIYTLKTQYE